MAPLKQGWGLKAEAGARSQLSLRFRARGRTQGHGRSHRQNTSRLMDLEAESGRRPSLSQLRMTCCDLAASNRRKLGCAGHAGRVPSQALEAPALAASPSRNCNSGGWDAGAGGTGCRLACMGERSGQGA